MQGKTDNTFNGPLLNKVVILAIVLVVIYLGYGAMTEVSPTGFDLNQIFIIDFLLWEHTAPLLALLMFAFACLLILQYHLTIFTSVRRDIEKISAIVSKRKLPELFTDDFQIIRDAFEDSRYLRRGWNEFSETLHKTPDEETGKEIFHNTKRPQEYINEDAISQSGSDIRRLEFYPGIFVAVGLVLTFIGLLAALQQAAIGIESAQGTSGLTDKTKEITEALEHLISASALKFWTSISGIGCSIMLTLVSRGMVTVLTFHISRLQNHLESGLIHLSAEKIQLQVVSHTKDLANGIRDGFSEAITEMSGNELRFFADRMGQIGEELQKADAIVTKLGDTYQSQLERINAALVSTSKEMAGQVKNLNTKISEDQIAFSKTLGEQYEQQFSRLTNTFNQNFEDTQKKLSEFRKAVQNNLEVSTSVLTETSDKLIEASREHLTKHSLEMSTSVQKVFDGATQEFTGLRELMDENLETSISSLSKSNEEFLESSKRQIVQHSAGVKESFESMGANVTKAIRSVSDEFKDNVGSQFETLSGMTENLISAMEKDLQDHNGMQGQSMAIIKSIESMTAELKLMKDGISSVSEKNAAVLTGTSEKLDAVSSRIQDYQETVQTRTDDESERLARTISGLESALKNQLSQTMSITENGRKLGANFETAVEKFAKQNEEIQNELIGAMKNLSLQVEASAETLKEAQTKKTRWPWNN